jgi:hypothetical protein
VTARLKRVTAAFAVLAVIGAAAYWLSVYWVPTSDLRKMGVNEVHWWNLQRHDERAWMDGSSQTFVYTVLPEVEGRMRQRCMNVPNEFPVEKVPPCYLYRSAANVSPDVSVTVGRGVVVLDYVWF